MMISFFFLALKKMSRVSGLVIWLSVITLLLSVASAGFATFNLLRAKDVNLAIDEVLPLVVDTLDVESKTLHAKVLAGDNELTCQNASLQDLTVHELELSGSFAFDGQTEPHGRRFVRIELAVPVSLPSSLTTVLLGQYLTASHVGLVAGAADLATVFSSESRLLVVMATLPRGYWLVSSEVRWQSSVPSAVTNMALLYGLLPADSNSLNTPSVFGHMPVRNGNKTAMTALVVVSDSSPNNSIALQLYNSSPDTWTMTAFTLSCVRMANTS